MKKQQQKSTPRGAFLPKWFDLMFLDCFVLLRLHQRCQKPLLNAHDVEIGEAAFTIGIKQDAHLAFKADMACLGWQPQQDRLLLCLAGKHAMSC